MTASIAPDYRMAAAHEVASSPKAHVSLVPENVVWAHVASLVYQGTTEPGSVIQLVQAHASDQDDHSLATLPSFVREMHAFRADAWLSRFRLALSRFSNLAPNWDTHGSPTPSRGAAHAAAMLLESLWDRELRPQRIAPSPDGGIMTFFFNPSGYATVETTPTGGIVAILKRENEASSVSEADSLDDDEVLDELLDGLLEFAASGPTSSDVPQGPTP